MLIGRTLLFAFALSAAWGSPTAQAPAASRPGEKATVAELQAALGAEPSDTELLRKLGIALHEAGRDEEALGRFQRLVELDPRDRHLLDLALINTSLSRLPEAEALYQRLLAGSPRHAIALHNMGTLSYRRGRYETAITFFRRAIDARPGYMKAYYNLGKSLRALERYREAYKTFEKVLTLEPSDGLELLVADDALYQLGALDLQMGATERAALLLGELVAQNPEHINAHFAYGRALLLLGRQEEAQREFDIHLELTSRQPPTGSVATGE